MRTTQKVCLYFCLSVCLLGISQALYAQSTMTFQYGEKEEFEGSLTAHLLMLGVDKETGQRKSRILRSSDHTIQYDRYEDLEIVLRISSFDLAREEHYETTWLEIPLKSYINQDLPGLILESKTKVLMLGTEAISRARKTGDIRYRIDPMLDREVSGALRFSFDFVSSDFPWKKIKFPVSLEYAIRSPLPVDPSGATSTPSVEETLIEESPTAEEEITDDIAVPEVEPVEVGPVPAEEKLIKSLANTNDKAKILELCAAYREQFPEGFYLEEVLFQQIEANDDPKEQSRFLEDYVELFPDGKHILQVNDLIFSNLSKNEELVEANPKEVVEIPNSGLSAQIKMKDGILSVNNIKGGQAPFRLEFFDTEGAKEKKYAIDIGKNRSFKINLNSLPLEKNSYVIGLVDEKGTKPYYSAPLNVSSNQRSFKVEVPYLSMVLGISILVIAVFLLILSRFFSKKRKRRRRRYPSKSYR